MPDLITRLRDVVIATWLLNVSDGTLDLRADKLLLTTRT